MLRRQIEKKLLKWKKEGSGKCLMVRGARQVGKTFSVEHFAKTAYPNNVEVNFLKTPGAKEIFSGNLDVDTLLLNFSVYLPGMEFVPGKTLVFLDEIQECPEALTSLKFFAEDKRFDVIVSGSMLGIDYSRPASYPVGSMSYLDMHALSFEEFLWAAGITDAVTDKLRDCFEKKEAVPEAIHRRITELLRTFLVIGGMPEVVELFYESNSIKAADDKQRAILEDYRYDIARYANADTKLKAERCYFSMPDQLAKENHKFQYSVVEKGGNARKYRNSLDWLESAYMIRRVYNTGRMSYPLRNEKDETNFRVYLSDIGLLTSMYPYEIKAGLFNKDSGKMTGNISGGLYEALCADMLIKNGKKELYFRKNEQATFELEFLMETSEGIVPLEVKASNSRSKSLDRALERDDIPYGYKLVNGNVGVHGKKITLPHYMAMFL